MTVRRDRYPVPQVAKTAKKDDTRERKFKLYGWEIDYFLAMVEPVYFAEKDSETKKFLARVLSQLQ